ncbi:MAG TPA: MBL fold metallo-hydrolase [Gammaproteobacteria bacterium]
MQAAARSAAAASLSVGLPPFVTAARAQSADHVDLGDGFHVLTLEGVNLLAVATGGGVALVDGGPRGRTDAVQAAVAGVLPGAGPIHTLFNTHWHPEQTGANEALGKAGATIVAHANTRLWLTTDVTWPWNNVTVEPLPDVALPNKTFYAEEELAVGNLVVRCGHLRDCAHTDGDIYVFFPEQNVMAVGGAVTGAGWPDIDWWTGGWIGGIVGALDMILTVSNDATRFVPAHGPVLDRGGLLKQFEMYNVIWERLLKTLYSGGGTQDALAARPTKEFDDIMGDSEAFVVRAFRSMWPYLSPDA